MRFENIVILIMYVNMDPKNIICLALKCYICTCIYMHVHVHVHVYTCMYMCLSVCKSKQSHGTAASHNGEHMHTFVTPEETDECTMYVGIIYTVFTELAPVCVEQCD